MSGPVPLSNWKLPEPPLHREWMKAEEWTREMLLNDLETEIVWRPLLVYEAIENGDEVNALLPRDPTLWIAIDSPDGRKAYNDTGSQLYRTRRPLPPQGAQV